MKLVDLYNRVVETTGLDIVTLGSLQAAISNCMADLTSRGYRTFKEVKLKDLTLDEVDDTRLLFKQPKDIRKILYLRLFFENNGIVASRKNIGHANVEAFYRHEKFRSRFTEDAIFFAKPPYIVVEWKETLLNLKDMQLGYYSRLQAPKIEINDQNDLEQLENVEIDIREEFEDALVLYAAYFYYARFKHDTEKIEFYLNNYKYFMEDMSHELFAEDQYFEENVVITEED